MSDLPRKCRPQARQPLLPPECGSTTPTADNNNPRPPAAQPQPGHRNAFCLQDLYDELMLLHQAEHRPPQSTAASASATPHQDGPAKEQHQTTADGCPPGLVELHRTLAHGTAVALLQYLAYVQPDRAVTFRFDTSVIDVERALGRRGEFAHLSAPGANFGEVLQRAEEARCVVAACVYGIAREMARPRVSFGTKKCGAWAILDIMWMVATAEGFVGRALIARIGHLEHLLMDALRTFSADELGYFVMERDCAFMTELDALIVEAKPLLLFPRLSDVFDMCEEVQAEDEDLGYQLISDESDADEELVDYL